MREFIINQNDAGQRVDKFLTKAVPKLPKNLLYKYLRLKRSNDRNNSGGNPWAESSAVLADGVGARKAHDMELCAGQSVQRHLFRYEGVYRDGAWLFIRSGTLEARR